LVETPAVLRGQEFAEAAEQYREEKDLREEERRRAIQVLIYARQYRSRTRHELLFVCVVNTPSNARTAEHETLLTPTGIRAIDSAASCADAQADHPRPDAAFRPGLPLNPAIPITVRQQMLLCALQHR
jgi:hypothetical protein